MRAEVFHTLEGPQDGLLSSPLSNENLLINELVREYLRYNGYTNALGVFLAESGQPSDRALDRGFIKDEVRVDTHIHLVNNQLRQAVCRVWIHGAASFLFLAPGVVDLHQ